MKNTNNLTNIEKSLEEKNNNINKSVDKFILKTRLFIFLNFLAAILAISFLYFYFK